MTGTLKLTRNQLATFLKDYELIKQFENLFAVVDEIAPDFVNEVATAAGIADAKAVQALDTLEALKQLIELTSYEPPRTQEQKNQEVLTWLSMQ